MGVKSKEFSKLLKDYKHKHKCCICGESADCCLEFHHIFPDLKLFSLRSVNEKKHSKEELLAELHKTCLICRNCHAKLHNGLLDIDTNYLLKYKL